MNEMRKLMETTAQLFDDNDVINSDDQEDALDTVLTKLEELDMMVAQVMDKDYVYAEVQDHIDQLRDLFVGYL